MTNLEDYLYNEIFSSFWDNYHIKEDINITIPLAYVISNFSPGDPDALGIIGASGSNKTELCRLFNEKPSEYIYPISSLTAHSFISGYKDNEDLAPLLKGRLLLIKDFTTILSKNKNEVALIFADIREVLDGYISKPYGNTLKKEYSGIHSSILFACTNAIERHYTLYSVLGQRIIFFRPHNDPTKSRQQAMVNAGHETKIRELLQPKIAEFIKKVITERSDRIRNLTHNVPGDMQERIGKLCDFLAIVRTHIPRTERGEQAALPEPEYPTRLVKTLCKIVDAHSVIYNRLPNEIDENVAKRLIYDNIPTERSKILEVLAMSKNSMTTVDLGIKIKLSSGATLRILDDLASLDIIEKSVNTQGSKIGYNWKFPNGNNKDAFITVINHRGV